MAVTGTAQAVSCASRPPRGTLALVAAFVVVVAVGAVALPSSVSAQPPARDCDPRRQQLTYVHTAGGELVRCNAYGKKLPQMEQRVVTPAIGRKSGEPMVAVTRSGAAFFNSINWDAACIDPDPERPNDHCSPVGGRTEIFRTRDLGKTWEEVTPVFAGEEFPPFENDPFLIADPVTDRVYSLDLHLPANSCSWLMWTDDEGETWGQNPQGCAKPVTDHQMMFVGPPNDTTTVGYENTVYYCGSDLVLTFTCSRSLDGGQTFLPAAATHFETDYANLTSCTGPARGAWIGTGHGAASFADDGTAYVPWGYCNLSYITVSRDNGQSWETTLVDDTAGRSLESFEHHESRIAIDRSGNVYYVWVAEDGTPRLSISRDHGKSWSEPIAVGAPGVTASRFVSIAAGDTGRIALQYYGTDVADGLAADDEDMAEAAWHAWTTYSLNALDEEPVFASTTANPADNPVRRGPCSGRCPDQTDEPDSDMPWEPGAGVYDFLATTIDPGTGRVWTSIVDVCNGACGQPNGSGEDPAIPIGAVGVQIGGTFLGPAVPQAEGGDGGGGGDGDATTPPDTSDGEAEEDAARGPGGGIVPTTGGGKAALGLVLILLALGAWRSVRRETSP